MLNRYYKKKQRKASKKASEKCRGLSEEKTESISIVANNIKVFLKKINKGLKIIAGLLNEILVFLL